MSWTVLFMLTYDQSYVVLSVKKFKPLTWLKMINNSFLCRNGSYPFPALGHRSHGGTDMKVTGSQLAPRLEMVAQSGPTWDPLPPFRWSLQDFKDDTPHVGHPDLWQFDAVTDLWVWPLAVPRGHRSVGLTSGSLTRSRICGPITSGSLKLYKSDIRLFGSVSDLHKAWPCKRKITFKFKIKFIYLQKIFFRYEYTVYAIK